MKLLKSNFIVASILFIVNETVYAFLSVRPKPYNVRALRDKPPIEIISQVDDDFLEKQG
jgi:hypothetical protein